MIESICDVAISYTSQDFNNWVGGIGSLLLGIATCFLAYAALKTIPDKLSQYHKSKEIITTYQKVVYRMYREVEASQEGMSFSLPKDVEQLTKILIKKFPQIGSKDDANLLMDDLMLDNYFRTVVGNATILRTAKWDTKNRGETVDQPIDNLPGDKN